MKIVLSSNPYRDHGLRAALEAKRILEQAGAQTVLCLPFQPKKGDRLELPKKVELTDLHTALPAADLLICFGGDGTILHAARDATLHHVPILGVNMGSMGFMAELERGELSLLAPLARGDFATEERMMLDVRVLRGNKLISQDLALNDAVISKGSMARVAEMEVLADRVPVTAVTGDGVIVATPTGSTAYGLSAGGPVIEPSAENMAVIPICAHALTAKSFVFSPERRIMLTASCEGGSEVFVSADGGQSFAVRPDDRVIITRSPLRTRLVRLKGISFYKILQQKL